MNIKVKDNKTKSTITSVLESFKRSMTKRAFLLENSDLRDADKLYSELSLDEAFEEGKHVLLENGMKLPGCNSRLNGKLSLKHIAENSESVEMFVEQMTKYCKDRLDYDLTENDKISFATDYFNYVEKL